MKKTGTSRTAKLRPLTSDMLWLVERKASTNGRIRNLMALLTSWEKPKSRTSRNRVDVAPRSLIQLYAQCIAYVTSLCKQPVQMCCKEMSDHFQHCLNTVTQYPNKCHWWCTLDKLNIWAPNLYGKNHWVIPFEIGHSHPGDHLQIAWNFSKLFTNICVGCVQNFN